jgi:hypothetical protein
MGEFPPDFLSVLMKEQGRSLVEFGMNEYSFSRTDALRVLDKCRECGTGVLGGDVGVWSSAKFSHTYDNWYCNQEDAETQEAFCARSIDKARLYIEKYPQSPDRDLAFVLVLAPSPYQSGMGPGIPIK